MNRKLEHIPMFTNLHGNQNLVPSRGHLLLPFLFFIIIMVKLKSAMNSSNVMLRTQASCMTELHQDPFIKSFNLAMKLSLVKISNGSSGSRVCELGELLPHYLVN